MSGRPREFDDVAVVEAAMEVFWSHGYEGASAQELVNNTGLGRGSLYNAFGSKQKLYHEALIRYQELGIEAQAKILNGPGSIKSRLQALMQWGIDGDLDPEKNRGCMALFAALERSGKDPKVLQISRVYVTKLEQTLCQLFAQGQQSGELSSEGASQSMARAFLSGYYGLRILGRSMPEREFLEDVMKGILTRL